MWGLTLIARDPSLVYVVYQPPQIFDMCRNWIAEVGGPPMTASYPPRYLSTLQYRPNAPPATRVFDFADLPCPPSDAAQAFDLGTPYSSILVPEAIAIFRDRGQGVTCEIAATRDPPVKGVRVREISGPNDDGDAIG